MSLLLLLLLSSACSTDIRVTMQSRVPVFVVFLWSSGWGVCSFIWAALRCNIRGQDQSREGVSAQLRSVLPTRKRVEQEEQELHTLQRDGVGRRGKHHVSFIPFLHLQLPTHTATLRPKAQRSHCASASSHLVLQILAHTYGLLKIHHHHQPSPPLLLLQPLECVVHPCLHLLTPPPPPPGPGPLRRPVARMDKSVYSPCHGSNKTNSPSTERGSSSSRKTVVGRTGSNSPTAGSGSVCGPVGAAGGGGGGGSSSRGAVLGNSMNFPQQQLQQRRKQLEGVLSKYTNLIQGWQNR